MDSVFLNGGFIGKTFDFADTSRYVISETFATIELVGTPTSSTGTSITLPTGLQEGDLVVVCNFADATSQNLPSGYTNGQNGFTNSVNYRWSYKFMGSTPDTTATGLSSGSAHLAFAFRGVDTTTPLDVTPPSVATNISGMPNPPSITTVTDNSVLVAVGYLDDDSVASSITAPSTYTLLNAAQSSGTIMAAYKTLATAGTDDAGGFGGTGTDSWVAAKFALRPGITQVLGNQKNSGIWLLQSVFNSLYIPTINLEAGLSLTDTWSVGQISTAYGTVNTVFAADLTFPVSPSDGLIWETGGTGQGAWLGIRDSGTTLRLRGGDGGTSKTSSTTDTAVLDLTDFPKDGQTHTIVWDFAISTGTVRVFIDGVLKGTASATGGSFDTNQFAGGDLGAFLETTTSGIVVGESSTPSNFTNVGTGLRVYTSQLVSV